MVVIYHPLAVMPFSAGNDLAHITGFYCIVSIFFHECESIVHSSFVVGYRARSFMMHDELHVFGGGIAVKFLNIKIRIGSCKVKDIFFPLPEPVFPAHVPALNKNTIKAMLSSKVNIFF